MKFVPGCCSAHEVVMTDLHILSKSGYEVMTGLDILLKWFYDYEVIDLTLLFKMILRL
jgi:hypothetical protein